MTIYLHKGDLPDGIDFGSSVAVDTETQGLNPKRDRLCVVQLSAGNGDAHLVQLDESDYAAAKNLKNLMENPSVTKIFHFARFDVAVMKEYLDVTITPVFCTKIASRLVRTYTNRHGLKDLTKELLGIELNKQQQSSDWAAKDLSDAQKEYAASDVYHLHAMRDILVEMLEREGRMDMAQACFDFLPTRADLDLTGWENEDIFSHS
jgi:ribonuclease D